MEISFDPVDLVVVGAIQCRTLRDRVPEAIPLRGVGWTGD